MKIIVFFLLTTLCVAQKSYEAMAIDSSYDGDTPTLILNLGFGIYKKTSIRLLGVDTPEMKGLQSDKAKTAKKALDSLICCNKKLIFIASKKHDKYGRELGTVFLDTLNVNKYMLRYGKAYNGGKKL